MKELTLILPKRITGLMILFFLLSNPAYIHAQKGIQLGVSVYPGFTLVNFEKALGYEDDHMIDWDQFYYSISIKAFLTSEKKSQFGAEISRQRLYYAYYGIPYPPLTAYREFDVSTTSIHALLRYSPSSHFFLTTGLGVHIFNNGVAASILVEPGYMINLGEKMKIPVSLRLNPVFGDGTPVPVSLGAGILFTVK